MDEEKLGANKLAAISAVWVVVIISSAVLLGKTEQFIVLLPILCTGGFLSVSIEVYTNSLE